MIRQLRGTVSETNETHLILDVGGVGYYIYMCGRETNWTEGNIITIYTYLAVRENALDLYGFATAPALEMFELLLGLPKIGPKSAAQIMANASLPLIYEAVSMQDASHLTKLAGIGKKTAETVVIGLKDKLDLSLSDNNSVPTANWQRETIDALIALGYPQKDARDTVLDLKLDKPSINEALKASLQVLSK